MKIRKVLFKGILFLLFAFIVKVPYVNAASCNIGISAPSSVVVGSTFTVNVNVSSNQALGSWEYTLSYDSSLVRLNSGQLHVVDYGNGSKSSASYSYSFTSLASGKATFKTVNSSVLDYSTTDSCLASNGSATVSMNTQAQIEANYSKNNNLSSLGVEGTTLEPEFNPNTLEYSAKLPFDTTKANITGSVQDKTATVVGLGEKDVVDGINKIEVIVTSQHGETKKYIINLTVEELTPIKVIIDKKEYTVIRKKGQVENIPANFVESTIKIGDVEVAAYKNETAKLTLVGLKDLDGKIGLFIYDEKAKTYMKFNELIIKSNNYIILDEKFNKVPKEFIKSSFKIDDVKYEGYKLKTDKNDRFYLVYAQNLSNGSKGLYLYDKIDQTFQKYYDLLLKNNDEKIMYLEYICLGLLGLFALILLIKFFKLFRTKKSKIRKLEKKLNKLKQNYNFDYNKDEKDESLFDVDQIKIEEKPVAKKIEDDEYIVPHKSKKQKLREIKEAKEKLDKSKPTYKTLFDEDDF